MRQIFDGVNNAWLSSWFKFCWTKFDKICQIIQMLDISWSKLFSQLVLLGKQWESSSAWGSSPPEPGSLMITMYRFWDIDECISYELSTKELSNELFFSSSVTSVSECVTVLQFLFHSSNFKNVNASMIICISFFVLIGALPQCHIAGMMIALIITGPMTGWWLPRMTIIRRLVHTAQSAWLAWSSLNPWWL